MSPQLRVAFYRAAIMASVIALTSSSAYISGAVDGRAALAGFLTSLAAIISRIGEGFYDTKMAGKGVV